MEQNLKLLAYYEDVYDLMTIKDCLRHLQYFLPTKPQKRKASPEIKTKGIALKMIGDVSLYYLKGNRYKEREKTINEWMRRDEELDNLVNSVAPSDSLSCRDCYTVLEFTDKHINDSFSGKPRVMLWYKCSKCGKRAAYFNNGEQYISKPTLCKKCGNSMTIKHSRKGDLLTTINTCHACHHKEKEVWDMGKEDRQWEEEQKKDKKLLTKYRSVFCMTKEEGNNYILSVDNLKRFTQTIDEWKKKQADPVYQKAIKLKKISIIEMEKLINDAITPEKYIRFILGQPKMERFVEVPFTAQDADNNRHEYDSRNQLKKLISKVLEGTNWRLMSDGITGRLGILSGRLKGMEQEEDLMKIVRKKMNDESGFITGSDGEKSKI